MSYFSLRKRDPEPEPDEDFDELDGGHETGAEEQPAEPTGLVGAVKVGLCGPGVWITARFGAGVSWAVHVGSVWAVGFYGGWIAAGTVAAWLLAVLLFIPREVLDRLSTWVERRDAYTPDEGDLQPPEAAPADPRHALARWLLDTIGKRPGIHLRELYPAMRNLPGQEGRTDAELRALLKGFGVRVSRSVRIGRTSGRSGVYRRDVEALLPSRGERPVEAGVDAGQGADSPPLSGVGEGL